ncbi:Ras GTPase [Modicella reniformis]|uniref:Ras GTPase n=1 Tax=Modicella reniformis TaxID=1440133 RepID=A0A9P6ST61_9FUNG|nr:Ras GTPase [Modicella reniformis]
MGSFQELVVFRDQIWRAKESEHVPTVVAANKCDLEEQRQVATEIGRAFAEQSNAFYIETSAKTGFNIHEMVHELVREIVRTRAMEHGGSETVVIEYPSMDDESQGDKNKNDMDTLPGMKEYVKSPTSTAPMEVDSDDGDGERERCCCMIM